MNSVIATTFNLLHSKSFDLYKSKAWLSGKEFCRSKAVLTDSHTMTPFMPLGNKPIENTVGTGEITRNEQLLLFPQCFLPIWRPFSQCHPILNYHLQTLSIWESSKYVDLESVKQQELNKKKKMYTLTNNDSLTF